jgi:hypothetical protein
MNTDVLARLHEANPFPNDVLAAADDELFARITAEPPSDTRRRAYRRPVVVVALALIAVAVLASTAFAVSQWIGGDVVKPDVTLAEYRAAQRQLAVPPGFVWPKLHIDPSSVTTRGGGGSSAVLNAEIAWDCYWVDAVNRGDAPGQARARRQLNTLVRNNMLVAPIGAPEDWVPPDPPKRPYVVFAYDGGYEWLQETIRLAAAGHPERLAQRCRANTPG